MTMVIVCFIIGQLVKHGAEKQLYELLRSIDRKKISPVVISLSQGGYWRKEIRSLKIELIELRRMRHLEFGRLFELIRLLRRMSPDIVHTYSYSANYYGRIAAILSRIPVIIASERNSVDPGTYKTRWQLWLDRVLSFFTEGIICNSYNASQALVRRFHFNERKVFTVQNGITFSNPREVSSRPARMSSAKKVIGTVGRLYPHKNHKLFLDIAHILLQALGKDRIEFRVVGDGPCGSELIEYTKTLGIEDCVKFLGEVEDVEGQLQEMDVFVMTSLYEGLCNAIMEAMLCTLPVVATDVGGNRELIVDNETGFLCKSNSSQTMADKIKSLILDEGLARRLGRNGKARILDEFASGKMVKETVKIYDGLMSRKLRTQPNLGRAEIIHGDI